MTQRPFGDSQSSLRILQEPDTDRLFTLLSERRRRLLLSVLATLGHPIPVDELADILSANYDRDVESRKIQIQLLHLDLPRLAKADLVVYSEGDEVVRTGSRLPVVTPLLEYSKIPKRN